jgi:hypothetical protein
MAKGSPPINSPTGGGGPGFFTLADPIGLQSFDGLDISKAKGSKASRSKDKGGDSVDFFSPRKTVISLRLAWASGITKDVSDTYLETAKRLAALHGLNITAIPPSGQDKDKFTFKFDGSVADRDTQAYLKVRQLAEDVHKKNAPSGALSSSILIIFCSYEGGYATTVRDNDFLPFTLINTEGTPTKDRATLLHELGHGAGLPHFDGDWISRTSAFRKTFPAASIENNFMSLNFDRSEMFRYQIEKIERAFFSGGPAPKQWSQTNDPATSLYLYGD